MPTRVSQSRGGGGGVVTLTWDRSLGPNIRQGGAIFLSVLRAQLSAVAREMEAFARANHPWQNRTGAAERSFTVNVVGNNTIVASHGVFYGVYLEFKHGGRWGVIPATLQYGAGRIQAAYASAWASAWRFS